MSFPGEDPNPEALAVATEAAVLTGADVNSIEYLEAFRGAYVPVEPVEGNAYLAAIDSKIAALKSAA
jgi:hypothetical protein